jgi:peptidoglycan/LPS O-acetylase OafA/YrhL
MGILRVYLALCVIATHAHASLFPWQMHSGVEAVQLFYIISGFYMAMVLTSSRYAQTRDFYSSRFLRVFLPYWTVLAVVFVLSLVCGVATHRWLSLAGYASHPFARNGMAGIALAFATNLTLFGQDWVMFLTQDHGRPLAFTLDFAKDHFPLWNYLLIPQCWSIGIELSFYLLVPLLNRFTTPWLVAIAVLASSCRFVTYLKLGTAQDPWIYRFFPFEIAFFVFGMLAYRAYAMLKPRFRSSWKIRSNFRYGCGCALLLAALYLHTKIASGIFQAIGYGPGLFACDMAGLLLSP